MKALRLSREAANVFEQRRPRLSFHGSQVDKHGRHDMGEWQLTEEQSRVRVRFFLPASPLATLCSGGRTRGPRVVKSWHLRHQGDCAPVHPTPLPRSLEVWFSLVRQGDRVCLAINVGPRVCVTELLLPRCQVVPLLDDFGRAFPSAAAAWHRCARELLAAI